MTAVTNKAGSLSRDANESINEFASVVRRIPGWPDMGEMDDLEEIDLSPDTQYHQSRAFKAALRERLQKATSRNLHSIKARALNSASRRKVVVTLPKLSCLKEDEE